VQAQPIAARAFPDAKFFADSGIAPLELLSFYLLSLDSKDRIPVAPLAAVGMETVMPRRRYQRGTITARGKRRRVWIGKFRQDMPQPDGTIRRVQRKVVLGQVKRMSKAEAIKAFQPYLDAVNITAAPRLKSGRSLRNFVDEWRSNVVSTLKPSTARAAESHLRTHILPVLGELPLTAITTKNVQAFISQLAAKGLTRKTCENVLQTLASIIRAAKAWRYVPETFDRSELSMPREQEKPEQRFFTAEEARRIIESSEEPYATLYATLGITACRAGEALGLKLTDLDFERRIIRVRRSLDAATRLPNAPKSKASTNDLPMPESLARRLQTYLESKWRQNSEGWLFCNSWGKPLKRGKVVSKLQTTLKKLGIERAALHGFRHGVASELLANGAAPSVVQRQMRHSSATVTLERYSHIIGDAQRIAVNSLAARVLGD
jgi:integrase